MNATQSVLVGDTPKETLYNLGCALQVLSDASVQQGHSEELDRGWWLLLQTLADVALADVEVTKVALANNAQAQKTLD